VGGIDQYFQPARLQLWGCSDKRFINLGKKGGLIYQS
jgi:hypothetical protein